MQIERRLLRDEVRHRLREWILVGRLEPGQKLEEPRLAAELGVSRTPLREALLSLERERFVRSESNKGFTVMPLSAGMVRETYPILGALEALAMRLSGPLLTPICPELRSLNAQMEADQHDARTLYLLDLRWHELLWRGCPNRLLVETIEQLKQSARRFDGAFDRGMADIRNSCAQHLEVIEALEAGDVTAASYRVEEHWKWGIDVVLGWLAQRTRGGEQAR